MNAGSPSTHLTNVLDSWWLLELFSPQGVPKPTRGSANTTRKQVVEWEPGAPLPWEELEPPRPVGKTRMVWRHQVYLGVYELDATYESLHRAFGEDTEAYDERPAGTSACAALVVDHTGRLITGSAVLSSAVWATAQLGLHSSRSIRSLQGFSDAANFFTVNVDEREDRRPRKVRAEEPVPLDSAAVLALLAIAQESAGLAAKSPLRTRRITIESNAVSARRTTDAVESDFLNSFFLDELTTVRERVAAGDHGWGLSTYLAEEIDPNKQIDVIEHPEAVRAGVTAARLPKGRWPSKPEHSLALSQQFAVNYALNELASGVGLVGVNGPPGTGKTTMLRDILAGNVVERARRLAQLANASDAFDGEPLRWSSGGGYTSKVPRLRSELTGFEMVVASSNNAAVENVTFEIPARDAIDERWHESADYFSDIATAVLGDSNTEVGNDEKQSADAWGLVAARLGSKSNRSRFHSSLWFDVTASETEGARSNQRLQTRLQEWQSGQRTRTPWTQAREAFAAAERRVDELLRQRVEAEARAASIAELERQAELATKSREEAGIALHQARQEVMQQIAMEQRAEDECARVQKLYEQQLAVRPSVLETIFSFGRALGPWRQTIQPIAADLAEAERLLHDESLKSGRLRARADELDAQLAAFESELHRLEQELASVRAQCRDDAQNLSTAYPDPTHDLDEQRAPWLDAELDATRSDLFLAALQLHEDFIANAADQMLQGLRAAFDVVTGRAPRDLDPEKIQAAWQLFFLVVPMVSTTFASFGRMFRGLGRESLGWLLIDEAGQASPQMAAGAIWRAQRTVVVGDPLQLQPVVTIPWKAQSALAQAHEVSRTWMSPTASVQTLADRVSQYGTMLGSGGERTWVSAPLRVHRRCDDPMFSLCNEIAYNGIMINGVHRALDDEENPDIFDGPDLALIAPSYWADEPATVAESHLQPSQIDRFERAMAYLQDHGVKPAQVIAISPFREVANKLASMRNKYKGLTAGTIHTAQGREADVVILVLGGSPTKPGAKAWAASSVNLVNVAASRAKRRIYVIGDREEWSKHNYFRQLSERLH